MSSSRDPFEMPGGAVGGIPARVKAKTEPIRVLRNTSEADRDRKSEFVAQCSCSL